MKNYSLLVKRGGCALVVCGTLGLMHCPVYAQGRTLSAAQLDATVSAVAQQLRELGLRAGERVVLAHPTSIRFVVDYLATLRAGLVAVPVNPAFTVPEISHVLVDSGAAGLITCQPDLLGQVELLRAAASELRVVVGDTGDPRPPSEPPVDPCEDLTGEAVAVLLYTSGTSGRARGAMLSARALVANIAQLAAVQPPLLRPDDVTLLPLPLFHVFGLNGALGAALWQATTNVLVAHFQPQATAELITRHGVTVVVGAPPMYAAWAARVPLGEVFAGVRLAMSGAASLPAALVEDYREHGVALYEGYGMTETAPILTCNAIGYPPPKAGSIGRPLPGIDARLVDHDGDDVADGDPGQLVVRGDNLFSGYWPDGAGAPSEGGFATADIAVRDEDGDLWLVGRTTDLVIVNGFNVYPAEVEAVIGALPGVAEVAVVGVDDQHSGEAVAAYLVPLPGAHLDVHTVRSAAARSLARYKVPTTVAIVDSLPHTVTGKVQKWRLIDRSETAAGQAAHQRQ